MALESITLQDDAATNYTYSLVSLKDTEALYRDSASALQNPRTLRIAHTTAKAGDGTDRHLIQVARVDDDTDGVPFTGSVHVVIALPREGVSQADLELEWEKLKNFVDTGFSSLCGGFFGS